MLSPFCLHSRVSLLVVQKILLWNFMNFMTFRSFITLKECEFPFEEILFFAFSYKFFSKTNTLSYLHHFRKLMIIPIFTECFLRKMLQLNVHILVFISMNFKEVINCQFPLVERCISAFSKSLPCSISFEFSLFMCWIQI